MDIGGYIIQHVEHTNTDTNAEVNEWPRQLDPAIFYQQLQTKGINFFCGVPDSLLKDFCAFVTSNAKPADHVITANEGNAVALSAGYHMATGRPALVYLQNSGLGNIVNPVMSLATPAVYSIPMLLLIGWRGEPGSHDEPQHCVQGKATPALLDTLGIPFQTLPYSEDETERALQTATDYMSQAKGPYALLVRRRTFSPYELPKADTPEFPMSREDAMKEVVDSLSPDDIIISTTGMLSRELYEYRLAKGQGHERDFLTVGSMGHASSIALGIALQKPNRQVVCLDGDGAAIMHMGAMATIGQRGPSNLKHVIINNGAHDSVGGQPTVAGNHVTYSFCDIAIGCGYKQAFVCKCAAKLKANIEKMRAAAGPVLLEVKVAMGARHDLGRPTTTPAENKTDFMDFLSMK